MRTSQDIRPDDFFHQQFSDPAQIVRLAPDAAHAGVAHQASGITLPPDMIASWDFSSVFNSIVGYCNALAGHLPIACAFAVAALILLARHVAGPPRSATGFSRPPPR